MKRGSTLCTVRISGIPDGVAHTNDLPAAARKVVCDFLGVSSRITQVPVYAGHDHLERTENYITANVKLLPGEYKDSLQELAIDLNLLLQTFVEQNLPNCAMTQTIVETIGGGEYGYKRWETKP